MCKIMAVTNLTKIPHDQLDKHLLELKDIVTVANTDGFGYSLSYEDCVFAEKFTKPSDFKGMLKSIHPKQDNSLFNYDGSVSYGHYHENVTPIAVIAHGRTSTNVKGYPEYSHPFYNSVKGEAFIHNGVVDVPAVHDYLGQLETPNDSEFLAMSYWDKGVKALQDIFGYFAFFNLKKDGVIEVIKDDAAYLYGSYCTTLQGYIFATTSFMIESYARKFSLEISTPLPVSNNMHAVIQKDKMISLKEFKRFDKRYKLTAQEQKAFKDYASDVKELETPAVKGEQTVGKNLPAVAGNAGNKKAGTTTTSADAGTTKKEIKPPKEKHLNWTAKSGRRLYYGMDCLQLTEDECEELFVLEDAVDQKRLAKKRERDFKNVNGNLLELNKKPKLPYTTVSEYYEHLEEAMRNGQNDPLYWRDEL